jgi:hypothetical protein
MLAAGLFLGIAEDDAFGEAFGCAGIAKDDAFGEDVG